MPDFTEQDILGFLGAGTTFRTARPFFRQAFLDMPRSIYAALRAAQFIYNSMGLYRSAMERVLSYFLTDIELKGEITDDQRKEYMEFLHGKLRIMPVLFEVGNNYLCYGNAFVSVQPMIRNYVVCPRCAENGERTELALDKVLDEKERYNVKLQFPEISLVCPVCEYSGTWHSLKRPFTQRRTSDEDIIVRIWNPLDIDIIHDPYTGRNRYVWRIPQYYSRWLKEGVPHILAYAPWSIIEAVATTERLLFEDDKILHLREPSLAGVREGGWGYPRSLINFSEIWQLQLLLKYNEALTTDYLMPMRVISPAPQGRADPNAIGGDILANIDGQVFQSTVRKMIQRHRMDPASWEVSPWPLQYQILGGEAKALVPHELLQTTLDMLFTSVGVPVELYKGSISHQAMPMAIRMFESVWTHLVHHLNTALDWIVQRVQVLRNWEPVKAKLTRPFYSDDVRRQAMIMNLAAAQEISRTTAFQSLGLDFREEANRLLEEQKYLAETQLKFQKDLEEMQLSTLMATGQMPPIMQQIQAMHEAAQGIAPGQGGGAPAGGGPAGQPVPGAAAAPGGAAAQPGSGGGMLAAAAPVLSTMAAQAGTSTSPQDMIAQAQQLAQQLLAMPASMRQSNLIQLKRTNPILHALVSQAIEDIRQQASLVGRTMVLQQQFGSS